MKHEDYQAQIDGYVDGTLSESERRALESHLKTCEECAEEVTGIRSLLDQTRDLPRSVEPSRDLWFEVETRIGLSPEMEDPRPAPAKPGFRWHWGRSLAMAAALAVVLSGVWLMSREEVPQSAPRETAELPAGVAPTIRALDAESRGASKQLMAALKSGPETVASTAVVAITENIKLLDQAVEESRAALAADPGNRRVLRRLMGQYEQRLTLLRRATRLANEDLV